ncbi:uncharacterized protein BDV14DRAFT_176821 [Aspergillus stella-maris]|uniref:uncharacterized protein n=1 Tax=Aspergillus stella-maris TaxID=1810926 RepID=UPI003CCC9C0C
MAAKSVPVTTTVLYPNSDNAVFNKPYYMDSHLPLASEIWGSLGMTSWEVVTFSPGPDESRPQYVLATTVQWTNDDAVKNAMNSERGKLVLEDIKNFTNITPVVLSGQKAGQWQA